MFFASSILNNAALGYSVSIPVFIIVRSGGTFVTMILSYLLKGKTYRSRQIAAVTVLTIGVGLATYRRSENDKDAGEFNIGILFLFMAQMIASYLGIYQESTYAKYGSAWREGLFYTHFLALPFFIPFFPRLIRDIKTLSKSSPIDLSTLLPTTFTQPLTKYIPPSILQVITPHILHPRIPRHLFLLAINGITQCLCIRGVNQLSAVSSAVTVAVVLNVRKFTSLLLSVWMFGSPLSWEGRVGAGMVLGGALGYAWETRGKEERGKATRGGFGNRHKYVRQRDKTVGSEGDGIDRKGEFLIGEGDIKENGIMEQRHGGRRRKL